ncbi:MAG: ATP-dependent zinc metalloprotease FtsH [Bacteroidota bacterium]|nr:ATP-dependent zinc metalloprotease FtsH [Bacteroidota bacterium]
MEKKPINKGIKPPQFNIYWIYTLILVGIIGFSLMGTKETVKKATFTQLEGYVKKGQVDHMVVQKHKDVVEVFIKDSAKVAVFGDTKNIKTAKIVVTIPSADRFDVFQKEMSDKYGYNGGVEYQENKDYLISFLLNVLPFLLLIFVWIYFMRKMSGGGSGVGGGGVFSVGKSKAQLFDKGTTNRITFKDVAGLSEAKVEVEEIVSFLKNPSKYTELGGKIPKGALLVGPPGTGKTLLAKAVAGEADVPFFSLSGSDFVEMFVGVGASRVRDLFRQAKEKAPCIVFIDEIDAVGRARGKNPNMGANDERENTLNQLLTEMDGFGSNSGVIILAATNRADILDKALLRAGRFDRQINVELPDINERREIFNVHLRPIKIDESVDSEFMARQTPGFSGADIANVCNEAALIAARKGKQYVQKEDFMDAVDRIIGGLEKKNKITTVAERRSIALHEAGHATLSWLLEFAHPLVKVTIVPRGKALGAAWYLPEERQLTTKEQMLDEMCSALGGRAAEELFLGHVSTGALNDLERVSKQAWAIVVYYGMSESLDNISYFDSSGSNEFSFTKPYSEKTAEKIDGEVKKMVNEQYARAKRILAEYAAKHNELADLLVEREVIFAEDLERIFGKRPWTSRTQEILDEQKRIDAAKALEETKAQEEAGELEASQAQQDEPASQDTAAEEAPIEDNTAATSSNDDAPKENTDPDDQTASTNQ